MKAVVSRLGMMLVLLWIVSLVTFGLTLMIPGDPAFTLLGDGATADQVAAVRVALGLDEPAPQRYLGWLAGVVQGDLGTSLFSAYPVSEAIGQRLPVTISLVLLSLLVSVGLGMLLGVVAATRAGGLLDRAVLLFSSMGIALPNFWLGLLLVGFIASGAGLLPVGGYVPFGESPGSWLTHLILPVLTLAAGGVAEIARQTRAGMVDVLQRDFIRTLRANGLVGWRIVLRHALRNALIPIVTVAGLQVSRLFGMAVLVESIFVLPGLGSFLVSGVFERDLPVIQGAVLVSTVIVLAVNLVVDLSYRWLDPRVAA